MKTRQTPPAWEYRPGDLLIADPVPSIDRLLEFEHGVLQYRPERMDGYLNFLEAIVLYERVIVGACGIETDLSVSEWPLIYQVTFKPGLHLRARVERQLRESGLLVVNDVTLPDFSAREYFFRHIKPSLLPEGIIGLQKHLEDSGTHAAKAREIAFVSMFKMTGGALYIAEVARRIGAPYHWNDADGLALAPLERHEGTLFASTVEYLRDRISRGARRELERIASLGGQTSFPATPIALQILSMATHAGDLCLAALELRNKYKSFRSRMCDLDTALQSAEVTVARKLRILDEIESLTKDLWPTERRAFRRDLIDTASFFAAIPGSLAPGIPSVASLASTILAQPIDAFIAAVRRRRYRMLFRAKRNFLRTKNMVTKLASILGVDRQIITAALDKSGKNKR